ncbi:sensor histidine kinase [Streptomyces sp. SID8379]|uniref:sensor histidine kinase n=1 Tax=unclassified Streptomyces TaxID=2593676 RepID=UPI0003783D1C|nr:MULTISPECIES: sensor histidine kinase [unclassified Streptomyces]MYW64008.1 sensor histidine kinase [Streptomyces sp. SID8379]
MDPSRQSIPVPHRWNAVVWVLFGLVPPALAVADAGAGTKYSTYGLLSALTFAYAAVAMFPTKPMLRPGVYLAVLVVELGAVAYLMGGGAALFIVSLPHFWIYAAGPAAALWTSGAGAGLTVLGTLAGRGFDGLSGQLRTGNVVFTVVGYAVGAGAGLLVHRITAQGEERAQVLTDELVSTQAALAEAHREQGAAEERERMAREIHDTLAQGFASIIVLAEAARSGIESQPARTAQQLTSIEQTARENLAEARALVGSTPPPDGAVQGSVAGALRRTLERFSEDTGLSVEAELPDVDCDQQTRIALLRCTQESLANVRKHAGASTAVVTLSLVPYGIELEITDDGHGFDVAAARGFGLDGMRKRLAELGGELTVTSSLGDGTRVLASLPLTHDTEESS